VVISYQACSQKYSLNLQSLELPPKCETGTCKTGQINPDLDQLRPPTKVLFVVDNSRTMELSQGYLANGVKSLADSLRGFDADFFVYSTTDAHQDKLDADGKLRVADDKPILSDSPFQSCQWNEIVDGLSVVKSGGVCPYNQPISYSSEIINLVNPTIASNLSFKAIDDDSKLSEESEKLSNEIKNVGVDGSSTETGICSLVRSIYNDNSNSFFHKGDNAAMVILSDENDASTPQNCLSRVTQEENYIGKSSVMQDCNPLTEKCTSVDYEVKYDPVKEHHIEVTLDYKCNIQKYVSTCPIDSSCNGGVQYTFKTLREKVKYSCLSKVPYTVSFNPKPTYNYSLNYQCEQFEDGVSVGLSSLNSIAYTGTPPASCINGSEISCDDNAEAKNIAALKCSGTNQIYKPSCKLKCIVGSNPVLSDKTYNDTDTTAGDRDLTDGSASILTAWVNSNYPGYTFKSAIRGSPVSTDAVETAIDVNCTTENNVGSSCGTDTTSSNYANSSAACGGKKVTSCTKKCIQYTEKNKTQFYIGSSNTDDKVNFCTNTNTAIKFYKNGTSGADKIYYSSIESYAALNIFPGSSASPATIVPGSCVRLGWIKDGDPGVNTYQQAQTQLKSTMSKLTCDGDYASAFDLTNACQPTNTNYFGISDGSKVYNCKETTGDVLKPALTKVYTQLDSNAGDNLCNQNFKVGDVNYLNLANYYSSDPKTLRSDAPISCVIKSASKNVTPSGVILDKKITHNWTFPSNVDADSSADNYLEMAFHNRSKELFGENGYFVSAIIRDAQEDTKVASCAPLGADQSLGTKYRSLVEATSVLTSTAVKGDVTSICSSDYSKALSSVSKWITETARRSYFVPEVNSKGEILAVSLLKESTGEEKPLTLGLDFEVVGNKVNFINPVIDPKGWIIKYIYWEPLESN